MSSTAVDSIAGVVIPWPAKLPGFSAVLCQDVDHDGRTGARQSGD